MEGDGQLLKKAIFVSLACYGLLSITTNITDRIETDSSPIVYAKGHNVTDIYRNVKAPSPTPTIPIPTPNAKDLAVLKSQNGSVLGSLEVIGPPLDIEPVNRTNAIVAPAININSPFVVDVTVHDKDAYMQALESGVAHALGTGKPNEENANTYLFAHSTANESNIARYAAVFTKLKDMEVGEKIILFYEGKRYDYEIVTEEIVPRFDTSVLQRQYDFTALTLQTCDPPGIPKNRFITTAKLVGVYDR